MIINYYGLFIALGILVGVLVTEKLRRTLNTKYYILNTDAFSVLPWLLVPAVIGARLYHVIDYWQYYSKNLLKVFFVWEGGLGIFGGLIGGIIGLWVFTNIKNQKPACRQARSKIKNTYQISKINFFLLLLDLGVIGLSIGQAIGRWGNYFNQELYGWPTNLPWGIYIRPENRLPGFEHFTHFQPLFLYESLGCWLIFFILMTVYRLPFTRKKVGTTFFLYLFLYSLLRFSLEFLRIGGWGWGILTIAQWISLGLAVISGRFFLKAFNQGI